MLFQSEFEVTEGCSSLEQGLVKPLESQEQVMEELAKEIEKSYADHPIIVFCDKETQKTLERQLRGMSFAKFRIGGTPENLEEIRTW